MSTPDDPDNEKHGKQPLLRVSKPTLTAGRPAEIKRVVLPEIKPRRRSRARAPESFATVSVINLQRLRLRLRRESRGASSISEAKLDLIGCIEEIVGLNAELPEVVVTNAGTRGEITSTFSIVSGIIYLSSHLSRNWQDGDEDPRVFETLRDAINVWKRTTLASKSGTKVLSFDTTSTR